MAEHLFTPTQEVLKYTPEDHPDNYYIESILKELKARLVGLDHSIKSCQLACSVTRIKERNHSKR